MNVSSLVTVPERLKLRAEDFLALDASGAFDRYAKSELIDGEIWVMNAIHSWHAKTMAALGFELVSALRQTGSPLKLFMPVSIALSDHSVPEPDLAIADDNDEGILPLAKVRLAIEVSDTTAAIDLGRKAMLYARHGVPEYWVVDRDGARIVQHWQPSPEGYAEQRSAAFGERMRAMTISGLEVATDAI